MIGIQSPEKKLLQSNHQRDLFQTKSNRFHKKIQFYPYFLGDSRIKIIWLAIWPSDFPIKSLKKVLLNTIKIQITIWLVQIKLLNVCIPA